MDRQDSIPPSELRERLIGGRKPATLLELGAIAVYREARKSNMAGRFADENCSPAKMAGSPQRRAGGRSADFEVVRARCDRQLGGDLNLSGR